MNTRQRFKAIVNFEPFDRLPLLEWASWWNETISRWHGEGLPGNLNDYYEICDYFGMDIYRQQWVRIRHPDCPRPAYHGSGIVENEEGYEAVRRFLYPTDAVDVRLWEKWAQEQERGDAVLWFTLDGFFWFARQLLGIEKHLYAFYDQPELIHRINCDLAEWHVEVIERICSVCVPDFMTFAEDMSYNLGSMLSKELFQEFLRPYYDLVLPVLRKRGILPVVDSDGDVSEAACWFEDAGLEGILPLERQAGVDITRLRADHPKMKFIGHFDKKVMHKGEAAIRTEFERLLPVAAEGGLLISCDHQTPPEVSLKDYQLYIRLFREYAQRAGDMSGNSKLMQTSSGR